MYRLLDDDGGLLAVAATQDLVRTRLQRRKLHLASALALGNLAPFPGRSSSK